MFGTKRKPVCQAANPALCTNPRCPVKKGKGHRVPSLIEQQREINDRIRELEENEKVMNKHSFITEDILKNSKIGVDKQGNKVASVFRSGIITPPTERGVEKESYEVCDMFKPDGRQGRMTGIFSSPSLHGVTRWVRGNSMTKSADIGVREIRVNPDEVYVYSINAWEATSYSRYDNLPPEQRKEIMTAFWNTGMTLTEWFEKVKTDPTMNPSEWELLLGENDVQTVKPVGSTRVVEATYGNEYAKKEMTNIFKKYSKK